MKTLAFSLLLFMILLPLQARGAQDVVNTVHNLSISGPGTFKSATITDVCAFCHTPHQAEPDVPLWNHNLSGQTYNLYGSSTLKASPGQPTGKSRLCLSCHDGTVALGTLVNPPTYQTMDLGSTLLTGRAKLQTDLRDDHPVSFTYDATLASQNGELANPAGIGLPLESGVLQCTSCHDPHEKDIKPFLHTTTLNGQLCTTCHTRGGSTWSWSTSSHATSTATWNGTGTDPWGERKAAWKGTTVAQNACLNCHTPHSASTPKRLVKNTEENTCYLCHTGTVASRNIQTEFAKTYKHPVTVTPNTNHDAALAEDPLTMTLHVECMDCHNSHAVKSDLPMVSFKPANPSDPDHSTPPNANARIKGAKGIDINGNVKSEIGYEYELCLKCHGVPGKSACGAARCPSATFYQMTRFDGVYNIRDKVNHNNAALVSYHPIEYNNPNNNTENPSLRTDIPLNKTTSLIYCADCHNSDVSTPGTGAGPDGTHGSTYRPILAKNYSFNPSTGAGLIPGAYAICFNCHNQTKLLNTPSQGGGPTGWYHNTHVTRREVACINCHDPHGSQKYNHLLNFLTYAVYGATTYQITPPSGKPAIKFIDDGTYSGTCYLVCHGKIHDPRCYDQNGKRGSCTPY